MKGYLTVDCDNFESKKRDIVLNKTDYENMLV